VVSLKLKNTFLILFFKTSAVFNNSATECCTAHVEYIKTATVLVYTVLLLCADTLEPCVDNSVRQKFLRVIICGVVTLYMQHTKL